MALITGVRTTGNIAANRLVVDMADQIALLEPDKAPFLTCLKAIRGDSRVVYNPKFEWLEDQLLGVRTLANGAAAADASTITVEDGGIFRVYDLLKVPSTGECMLVTAVSGNTLTVSRGYGSTVGAAVADDAEILIIGNAQAENAGAREVKSTQETPCYNYTQIFRTPIALSNTEKASKMYGGKDLNYQRKKAGIEHIRDIANALYFGQRKLDTSGATPRRSMGGILEFLANDSRAVAFNASSNKLTFRNFDAKVAREAFSYGSEEKLLVAGPYLASAINDWASQKLVTEVGEDKTMGMTVRNLITSYGNMKVVYDPLLMESAVYAGYGFVLDLQYIRYVYLDGRDTKLNTNIQARDVDGVMDEYITECSVEFKQPKAHMLITGCYEVLDA
ncbi:MAG: DUF5309 domain-containing protein [Firmicutes bacterium]|nr:DUF5309 domain-containing protein [Bacillota bacterium]